MKIAIDISPLSSGHYLQHRVRGTGFYLTHLKEALLKYYPENNYVFSSRGEDFGKDTQVVHYPYFEPYFLTLPFLAKFKYVVTVHDLTPLVFPKNFPPGIRGKLKWALQKRALEKASAIITDSESSKNDIIRLGKVDENIVHVVYLAAGEKFKKETIQNKNDFIKKYNLPERFALYVGDATWNKNLPRLVEAVKKVNIPIVMVGSALVNKNYDKSNPWNYDLFKVQEEVKDNKNFILPGFVPDEDLITFYNLANVFVAPSLYEGFGLPILEAMACGCPVVTTKEGSIPEVAGDSAFYVEASNVDSIAKGIKTVFNDEKLRNRLSEEGVKQSAKFSWKKTASGTLGVYKSVVNE